MKAKVATGRYNSAREMKLEALWREISQGMTSVEQGRAEPLDIEAIKAEGRSQLKGKADQRALGS